MGVYNPNMEKPKDCRKCPRRIQYDDGWSVRDKCLELNRDIHYKYDDRVVMQDDCPLIEIVECKDCPHGIPNDYYVICKRDNRRMSPYDFCSLSTDDELYHPYGVGVIHKWEEK